MSYECFQTEAFTQLKTLNKSIICSPLQGQSKGYDDICTNFY